MKLYQSQEMVATRNAGTPHHADTFLTQAVRVCGVFFVLQTLICINNTTRAGLREGLRERERERTGAKSCFLPSTQVILWVKAQLGGKNNGVLVTPKPEVIILGRPAIGLGSSNYTAKSSVSRGHIHHHHNRTKAKGVVQNLRSTTSPLSRISTCILWKVWKTTYTKGRTQTGMVLVALAPFPSSTSLFFCVCILLHILNNVKVVFPPTSPNFCVE